MFSTRKIAALIVGLFAGVVVSSCADPYEEPLPRRDRFNYPVGLTVNPNGRFLYVVNSNFDTRYLESVGGSLSVVDLDTLRLLPDNGPYLPSFGGFVGLSGDARRAYVTSRNQNTVIALGVAPDGSSVYCDDGVSPTSNPSACSMSRVPDQSGAARIPDDPYALDVATIPWTNADGETFDIDLVNIAHLRGESVTSIALPQTDGVVSGRNTAASSKSAAVISGGSAVARRPGTRDIYVGGRNSREVVAYYPYLAPDTGAVQAIVRRTSIPLGNLGQSVDTRGLAFAPDGNTLYVVTRAPSAVHVVDLGPSNAETGTGTTHKAITSFPVARNPSGITVHTTATGETLLYVPSFAEEMIEVYDPKARALVSRIELGAQPYQFVVDAGPSHCIPGGRCRGYVTLFNDLPKASGTCQENRTDPCGSIGVIELDPTSPRYHQLIGKVQ